ncbi:SRPBCC family protein [Massilia endophytica]|uniref:SRPBCC family protein n=1 Tax=Massilia endophytica TaxID=2899220 RepID=UPI001E5F8DE4|nr:SRPBCC family protein [Massilia endophytica]UGQ45521.1 SRPBCC family protein [Massilia endophytica]
MHRTIEHGAVNYRIREQVAAPPPAVWAVLADVAAWPEWTPTMGQVSFLDEPRLAIGTCVRIRQPRLPTAVWVVSALEQGRSFAWRTGGLGVVAHAHHAVEALPDASGGMHSLVTLSVELRGPFAKFMNRLIGRLNEDYLKLEMAGLQKRCAAA